MLRREQKPAVLVVDDTLDNIRLVNEILKEDYRIRVATNGEKALEAAKHAPPDIILMDVMMPVMNGYEACRRLKEDEALKDIPVLFLMSGSDEADERKGFALGAADYIAKPISPPILTARMKTHLALRRSRGILENQHRFLEKEVLRRTKGISVIQEAFIAAMATLAETRDNETGSHIQRTKLYVKELAEYMGRRPKYKEILTPEKIHLIVISSPLHDIGKVGIPDHILFKPGALSQEEYEIMKRHTTMGRDAIASAEKLMGNAETFLTRAREIAYSHHEKWNGTGYPLGLSGDEIPLSARLMAVADVYDALTTRRIYKEAITHEEAVSIIREDSGRHFDPDVVAAFLALQGRFREIIMKYAACEKILPARIQDNPTPYIRKVP